MKKLGKSKNNILDKLKNNLELFKLTKKITTHNSDKLNN